MTTTTRTNAERRAADLRAALIRQAQRDRAALAERLQARTKSTATRVGK